jgi:hypothetical protein
VAREESRETESCGSLSNGCRLGLWGRGGRIVGRAEGERERGVMVEDGALEDPKRTMPSCACELNEYSFI